MCGIVGVCSSNPEKPIDLGLLWSMCRLMEHRGPQDEGLIAWGIGAGGQKQTHVCPPGSTVPGGTDFHTLVALGHRRLSVIDLSSAGHQPMSTADGTVWITYNGEVYNYRELRRELEAKGHTFHSNTDTEVILRLYADEGPDCVRRLNGMFAFAIWDARKEELFLARDHFGIKPLYYHHQGGFFAFASEMKALLRLPYVSAEVDLQALDQYLTFLWVPDPKTMLQGISKLPAGHYALYRHGDLQITQYWDLTFPPEDAHYGYSESDLVYEIRERFRRSVQSQMMSDVPLGAFLSAGIDSSGIVAMMSDAASGPLRTYTIAFPPEHTRGELTLDDPEIARRTAQKFGCTHTEIVVSPDVTDLLPKVIWHLDEPIADPAAITAYLVCREAAQNTTVLLSGVGGDELFAGYRKYIGHGLAKRYQLLPSVLRRRLLEPLAQGLPSFRGTPLKGYIRLAKKMARSGSLKPQERFIMDGTYQTYLERQALFSKDLRSATAGFDPWSVHRGYFEHVKNSDFLNQMLYLDSKAFMASLNLSYNDKMSMASSVEVRVPFLDWELAEFVAQQVPPALKLNGHSTKYIFRKAMEGILPSEVLRAPKAGFGAPADYWLARDLRPMVNDLLSKTRVRHRGYFDPAMVTQLIQRHSSGSRDYTYQLWGLLTFELWLQTFVDHKPALQSIAT